MKLKGILFDYGGTLDTDGLHWSEVLWKAYRHAHVEVGKDDFREAYVHGERTLAEQPLIQPHHDFLDLLRIKVQQELTFLIGKGKWKPSGKAHEQQVVNQISGYCNNFVLRNMEKSRPVVSRLAEKYPLVLVTNFYGNIHTVLARYGLDTFFQAVVESAVVGVRKPDDRIFTLGVEALRVQPHQVVVVGDSLSKDIRPARLAGCQTVWLRGMAWDGEQSDIHHDADRIITSIDQLEDALAQME